MHESFVTEEGVAFGNSNAAWRDRNCLLFGRAVPDRKPGSAKPAQPKAALRNTQVWRAIEDMKESRRLNRDLKEVYDDDGAEEE